jgi:hypothetical protein
MPEAETVKPPFKFDLTINLPTLVMLGTLVFTLFGFVQQAQGDHRDIRDTMDQVRIQQKDVGDLKTDVAVIKAGTETQGKTLERIEGQVAGLGKR